MVRIRMQRLGRTHRPFYRIGATDTREPRSGTFIEQLGWYDPITKDPTKQLKLNAERIRHWLDQGAQPSDTVRDILARNDLLTPAQMQAWEAEREVSRRRVECRKCFVAAQAILAEFDKKLDTAGVEPAPFKDRIAAATAIAKRSMSKARVDEAKSALADAQTARAELDAAITAAKAPKEAPAAG